MNIESELSIAKEAALVAGNLLLKNKDKLLQMIKSSARDIKLQADISAEKNNRHYQLTIKFTNTC